jgi:hypothetical protein
MPNGALRAPRPWQVRCFLFIPQLLIHPPKTTIFRNKLLPFWPKLGFILSSGEYYIEKSIMSSAITAALIPTAKLMICRENPAKIPVLQKSAKVYHFLFSSTEQLQVAL